ARARRARGDHARPDPRPVPPRTGARGVRTARPAAHRGPRDHRHGGLMLLPDKVAVITGAGAGIGRRLAERFAAEGASVVIGDIDLEAAQSAADVIAASGARALAVRNDVVDEGSVDALVSAAIDA